MGERTGTADDRGLLETSWQQCAVHHRRVVCGMCIRYVGDMLDWARLFSYA